MRFRSPLANRRISGTPRLPADRLEQHGIPVKIQELLLTAGEPTHVNNLLGLDTMRRSEGRWATGGDDELSVVFEANEAPIEQMIDAGR